MAKVKVRIKKMENGTNKSGSQTTYTSNKTKDFEAGHFSGQIIFIPAPGDSVDNFLTGLSAALAGTHDVEFDV